LKTVVFSGDAALLPRYLQSMMNAFAPGAAPPRRINDKNSCPFCLKRDHEAGAASQSLPLFLVQGFVSPEPCFTAVTGYQNNYYSLTLHYA
jgi:hypothetical protein